MLCCNNVEFKTNLLFSTTEDVKVPPCIFVKPLMSDHYFPLSLSAVVKSWQRALSRYNKTM